MTFMKDRWMAVQRRCSLMYEPAVIKDAVKIGKL